MDQFTCILPCTDPSFTKQSLRSILSQTYEPIRVIVSDNSAAGHVVNDPDIQRIAASADSVTITHSFAWAEGDRVKHFLGLFKRIEARHWRMLFEDDLLSPLSTEYLVRFSEQHGLAGCCHGRYSFSHETLSFQAPAALDLQSSNEVVLPFEKIAELLFLNCTNFFGEPPFSVYRGDTLPIFQDSGSLEGHHYRYLGDVIVPLLISERFGGFGFSSPRLGYFRKHAAQDSGLASPVRLSGLVEWELISRYLNGVCNFSSALVQKNKERLRQIYGKGVTQFPFLLERHRKTVLDDHSYVLNDEFLEFFQQCRAKQGLST